MTLRTITAVRPAVIALSVFACGVVAAYLVYAVFERWSYVRFLLPAISLIAVLLALTVDRRHSSGGARLGRLVRRRGRWS